MRDRPARRRLATLVAVGLLVQGCASPGKPVTQTVRVETPGCEQASCELSNDRGTWHLPSAPGTVALTTSHAPLNVVCRAAGGAQGRSATPSAVAAASGAGALAGGVAGGAALGAAVGPVALSYIPALGVITVLAGAAVGAVAGQTLESGSQAIRYPDLITVPMNCGAPGTPAPQAGGAIGLGIRGLPAADARTLGLGERGAVLVTAVTEAGAAAAAGLRRGDIVVAAAGRELHDAADFEELLLATPPGTPLPLRVWRDGQWLTLTLARRADSP